MVDEVKVTVVVLSVTVLCAALLEHMNVTGDMYGSARGYLWYSPSSCWHGLPALQQHLVGSYREDTCAGWELLEYMVNAVAFVL